MVTAMKHHRLCQGTELVLSDEDAARYRSFRQLAAAPAASVSRAAKAEADHERWYKALTASQKRAACTPCFGAVATHSRDHRKVYTCTRCSKAASLCVLHAAPCPKRPVGCFPGGREEWRAALGLGPHPAKWGALPEARKRRQLDALKARRAKWTPEQREAKNQQVREWRAANRDKMLAQRKAKYAATKEVVKQKAKEYYVRNKVAVQARKKLRESSPGFKAAKKASNKAYRESHSAQIKAQRASRARKAT